MYPFPSSVKSHFSLTFLFGRENPRYGFHEGERVLVTIRSYCRGSVTVTTDRLRLNIPFVHHFHTHSY